MKKRLDACDVSMTEYTKQLIPEDPVIFVEMNDLDTYLKLIDQLSFCTDVVELASVKENTLDEDVVGVSEDSGRMPTVG